MFGYSGNCVESKKACVRNLEDDAKRLKNRLKVHSDILKAMGAFLDSGEITSIDSYDDRRTLFAFYGGLCLGVPAMDKRYDDLLKEIEGQG